MFIKTQNDVGSPRVHLRETQYAEGGMVYGPGGLCPSPQIWVNKATGKVSTRCACQPRCQ